MRLRPSLPVVGAFLATAAIAGSAIIPVPLAAHAASLPAVTKFTDGSAGSLRAAITAANVDLAPDTITLGSGTYTLSLTGLLEDLNASGDLDVREPLTINGAGRNATIIDATSVGERAFDVTFAGKLTLNNLTVKGGNTSGTGGAIRVTTQQRLTLQNVVLDSNKATTDGGAIATDGPFNISGSTISNNKTVNAGTVGGAIWFGATSGFASIDTSTFNNNTVNGNGAAVSGSGLSLAISNSTFSGNVATGGQSALWNEGGVLPWTVDHTTITKNVAVSGGAVAVIGNGVIQLKDSIVVANTGGQCSAPDFIKNGVNVFSDASCGAASFNAYVLVPGVDPGLYPLADNGGGTKTHALKFDSPAVNQTTCLPAHTDQRGIPLPTGTQRCDVGAYERAIIPVDDPGQLAQTGRANDIDVYANDLGTDGYTLGDPISGGASTITTAPQHGTAAFVSTHVVYTPTAGYLGTDSFVYQICVALQCGSATVGVTVKSQPVTGPPPGGYSQFEPISPKRILDTRDGVKPAPGSTTVLKVTGVAGVPDSGVSAVVLNVTATEATAAGFVTVFPTGQAKPTVSNLNLEYVGESIPNLVTVPVGADGSVSLFTQNGTHLVADISGYYRPATDMRAGRFLAVTPNRLLDTRTTNSVVTADHSIDLAVTGVAGVPVGATAVGLNVTATEALAPGYVTVWPAGDTRPVVSNLNINHPGQTIPNLVIVPVGADGKVSLYSQSGTHLVVDITGYYTNAAAAPDYLGLFVPVTPTRSLDTRPDKGLGAQATLTLPFAFSDIMSAVVLNITATEATSAGYVTAWPTGQAQPVVSNLNVEQAGQTIPNAAILGVGPNNSIDLFSQNGTQLIVDIAGYFIVD